MMHEGMPCNYNTNKALELSRCFFDVLIMSWIQIPHESQRSTSHESIHLHSFLPIPMICQEQHTSTASLVPASQLSQAGGKSQTAPGDWNQGGMIMRWLFDHDEEDQRKKMMSVLNDYGMWIWWWWWWWWWWWRWWPEDDNSPHSITSLHSS